MDIFIARQPILNVNKKIVAYELLYRDSDINSFSNVDGNIATSNVITNSFENIGLDKLSDDKKVFINFTEKLIIDDVASLYPKEKLVIEVLETVKINEAVIKSVKELYEQGYTIALDDFMYDESYESILDYIHIIKIDFLKSSYIEIEDVISKTNRSNIKFLAEKIETYEVFDIAKNLGFTYFQGYFFSKPQIVKNKSIAPSKLTLLQLLKEVSKEELDFDVLSKIISQDPILSYRLLKLINSIVYAIKNKITNVRHALLMLGETQVKKWISLIAVKGISGDDAEEIVRMSFERAKLLEIISSFTEYRDRSDELFLLGLFSLLDVFLKRSFDVIFEDIPLSTSIKDALIHRKGEFMIFYNLLMSFEKGEFEEIDRFVNDRNIDKREIVNAYYKAIVWSNEVNIS